MSARPAGTGRTAFVTGVGGQDGSYLAERLLADGLEVHALARGPEPASCPPGLVLHRGDLREADRLRGLLEEVGPDEVYNLAAVSSVAESWSSPSLVAAVNGSAVVDLLDACWRVQERRGQRVAFVQASSAEIFGSPRASPQDEATPVAPVNPYGAAKAFAHLAVGVWRARGLHASSAILYSHESPRRPGRFVTRKITSTVAAIARGEASSLVLGNLDARRDWGWAPDHVAALVLLARAPRAGDRVVATGESHSVRDFVAAAFAHAGVEDWEPLVSSDPALFRPADPVDQVGDASLLRRELGWAPTVGFDELVRRMVDADLGR